ncbi:hypothetical protein LTR28_008626, partial [Elasticomyces elasticus]
MAQTPSPVPLLAIGRFRKVAVEHGHSIAPHSTFPGIIDVDSYTPQTVRVLLATLNPYPAGVIVGGAISLEVQQEVERVVQEHNAEGCYKVKLVCIPMGLRDRVGPAGLLEWLKDALAKTFG